jgi:transcriptional regulator with XRE-family HTH domain
MGKTLRSDAHAILVTRLRQLRQQADLTQAEVAERLGRPQSYVAKTESGERRLDVVEFVALVQALDADPAAVVREVGRALGPNRKEDRPAAP